MAETVLFQRGEESDEAAWDDTALIKAYDDAVSDMKAQLAEANPEFAPLVKPKAKKKKRNKNKNKSSIQSSSSCQWNVGDLCQAVFTEDSEIYEARILSIQPSEGSCIVQYLGYGNEEEQSIDALLPPVGIASSQRTDTASETESVNPESSKQVHMVAEIHRSKKSKRQPHPASFPPVGGAPLPAHTPIAPFTQMPSPHMIPPFQAQGFPSLSLQGPPMGASPASPHGYPGVPPPPPLFPQPGPASEGEAMYSMLISWYMSGYHTGFYQGLKQAGSGSGASPHR